MPTFRCLLLAAGGLLALLPAGCSEFVFVPVRGKVTLKTGQPVGGGIILLMPAGENKIKKTSSGKIQSDGTYELNTEGISGVAVGSYVVMVKWPMTKMNGIEPSPPPFSMKYFYAEQTPLKLEVVADPAPGAYDFVLDPAGRKGKD